MAAVIVLLLIGCLAIVGIGLVNWVGPILAHGTHVQHEGGKILTIESGKDFIFLTDHGQRMNFECRSQCRASLGHMQRHVKEKAHTDVYYLPGPDSTLMVIDVD